MDYKIDNVEDYVLYTLFLEKDAEKRKLGWQRGFTTIISNAILDEEKLESLIENLSRKFPPFTPVWAFSFTREGDNMNHIRAGILVDRYLPISEDYHLSFWTTKHGEDPRSDYCKIRYMKLPTMKDNVKESVPYMTMRLSKYLPDAHKEIPDLVEHEDSSYSIYDAFDSVKDAKILTDSYEIMSYVVNECRRR